MIVERFRAGNPTEVGERFAAKGRLMPDDVRYISSWMTEDGRACYQIMEAENRRALDPWIEQWEDLVEFEVTPVQTSADYWKK